MAAHVHAAGVRRVSRPRLPQLLLGQAPAVLEPLMSSSEQRCVSPRGATPLQPMSEPKGAAPPGLRSEVRATREGGASEGGRGGGRGPQASGEAQPRSKLRELSECLIIRAAGAAGWY